MATISGKNGLVKIGGTTLAEITRWTFTTISRNAAFASSSSAGFKKRVPGVKDGAGVIQGKLDIADPITDDFDEGSEVTLTLSLDGTLNYSVPAVIDSLNVITDVDDGSTVSFVAEFSTNGAWTKPTYS